MKSVTKKKANIKLRALYCVVVAAVSLAGIWLVLQMLSVVLLRGGISGSANQTSKENIGILDQFDMHMTNQISNAMEGVLAIEKVYWLRDEDVVAPKPNPDGWFVTDDPKQVQWLLDEAADLLEGQELLFSTDVQIFPGSQITCYLDETILSISWKELRGYAVYTISEIKIADPSQFRRFLADGEFGSSRQYLTTEMAASVNAVTASNADFYKHRQYGVVIYNETVYRADWRVDTCYIDDHGDMLFTRRGEISTQAQAQQFMEENNVRFSLAFGPILIDDYQSVDTADYPLGEVKGHYSRAALAMMDELHYLLVTVNHDGGYSGVPNIATFTQQLMEFGCWKAYALDGGQTAAIVSNGQLMNRPDYGTQRTVSDIIYFATAVPEEN